MMHSVTSTTHRRKLPINVRRRKLPENYPMPSLKQIRKFHLVYRRICTRKGIAFHHYPLNIIDDAYKKRWLQIAANYLSLALRPLMRRHLYRKSLCAYRLAAHALTGFHRFPSHVLEFILSFIKPVW